MTWFVEPQRSRRGHRTNRRKYYARRPYKHRCTSSLRFAYATRYTAPTLFLRVLFRIARAYDNVFIFSRPIMSWIMFLFSNPSNDVRRVRSRIFHLQRKKKQTSDDKSRFRTRLMSSFANYRNQTGIGRSIDTACLDITAKHPTLFI